MAFNYLPSVMQVPQLDYSQGMQQQRQDTGLGGLTQLLGGLQSLQASGQAQPKQVPQQQAGVGYGVGQDLVSPSTEMGQAQYAESEQSPLGGGFLSALQSIMLGGGAAGIADMAGKSGSPGLGAISGLASANPLLSSLTKGGISGALGNTIGGKLGGLF